MYLPRAFAGTDLAALDALIDAHPFVTVISTASPSRR
jgi:predicted FMN-binding regulatory protein PaiB